MYNVKTYQPRFKGKALSNDLCYDTLKTALFVQGVQVIKRIYLIDKYVYSYGR